VAVTSSAKQRDQSFERKWDRMADVRMLDIFFALYLEKGNVAASETNRISPVDPRIIRSIGKTPNSPRLKTERGHSGERNKTKYV
jgi:hypothetical protein